MAVSYLSLLLRNSKKDKLITLGRALVLATGVAAAAALWLMGPSPTPKDQLFAQRGCIPLALDLCEYIAAGGSTSDSAFLQALSSGSQECQTKLSAAFAAGVPTDRDACFITVSGHAQL